MSEDAIEGTDIEFRHSLRRMVALRDCPRIEMAGMTIGPFKAREIFQIEYSIGRILERKGVARFDEEILSPDMVFKIHWKENVQTPERLSSLPKYFYPMLRRLLAALEEKGSRDPDKLLVYKRLLDFSRDIVNCRLRKVVRLATISAPKQVLENLTPEERALYDAICPIVNGWRARILGVI